MWFRNVRMMRPSTEPCGTQQITENSSTGTRCFRSERKIWIYTSKSHETYIFFILFISIPRSTLSFIYHSTSILDSNCERRDPCARKPRWVVFISWLVSRNAGNFLTTFSSTFFIIWEVNTTCLWLHNDITYILRRAKDSQVVGPAVPVFSVSDYTLSLD